MKKAYKTALRDLLQRKGKPVEFFEPRYEGDDGVSTWGWVDNDAHMHTVQISDETREKWGHSHQDYPGCRWVIPEGAEVRERTYSMAVDTDSDNYDEVGINVYPAHCECGKYTDMTLRYTASLAETLRELFGTDDKIMTL